MNKYVPLEYNWDGKIRSARELFRLLHDFLNKYKYEHIYDPLIDIPGAIQGTAIFKDDLIGKKDYKKRNKGLLIAGIILVFIGLIVVVAGALNNSTEPIGIGFFIFLVGLILLVISSTTLRKSIKLHVEGETYRARAQQLGKTSSEVYDVVSDCRVVFTGQVGKPQKVKRVNQRKKETGDKPEKEAYGVSKLTTDEKEWNSLQSEFESLKVDFEKLRPKIEIPKAIPPVRTD